MAVCCIWWAILQCAVYAERINGRGDTGRQFLTVRCERGFTPSGLASHNGVLYMVGARNALYTLNVTTGVATRVGSSTNFGVSEFTPTGLASHNGVLYMVGDNRRLAVYAEHDNGRGDTGREFLTVRCERGQPIKV